ncbi:helix-turn-helix domain-containing protein [Halorussus salilacus]|uniref:helix-turn-helix domain-containing protein n=1 Tax=Halorussus salilacus TaxID=2953750 RepID=UPI00209D53F3|nr:helix-turn-helix domain-containing protein [Halorussus salilacus]USZ66974.1 helix-turn-helix domain-containing protein [Halorussus salilacus]
MHEAVLGIEQPGAYADATAGTDTTVELWCNDHCDLLHVGGAGGTAVVEHVEEAVGVRERLVEGDERLLITDACLKERADDNIEPMLAAHDCLLVPPLRYSRGAKWCRVLALDPASLTGFYRDVAAEYSVTVESKREVESVAADRPLLTLDSALPDLSARQREVLLAAAEAGYYRIPRGVTTAELAAEVGVERRTLEEHLRRAENKLVASLAEYL